MKHLSELISETIKSKLTGLTIKDKTMFMWRLDEDNALYYNHIYECEYARQKWTELYYQEHLPPHKHQREITERVQSICNCTPLLKAMGVEALEIKFNSDNSVEFKCQYPATENITITV